MSSMQWQDKVTKEANREGNTLTWKYIIEFDVSTLRVINPVPMMVDALMEIQGLQEHRQAIFVIINELFANALDHGLLGLDSSLKSSPEGYMHFYALKDQRLQHCMQGKIGFVFVHKPSGHGGRLRIKVWDSGGGFNWRNWGQELDENLTYYGRGLKLVENLCTNLAFRGRGNQVTADFDWKKQGN